MVDICKRYTCDACRKEAFTHKDSEDYPAGWSRDESIGDLCASCASAWVNFKSSFVTKMRKDNGVGLYE